MSEPRTSATLRSGPADSAADPPLRSGGADPPVTLVHRGESAPPERSAPSAGMSRIAKVVSRLITRFKDNRAQKTDFSLRCIDMEPDPSDIQQIYGKLSGLVDTPFAGGEYIFRIILPDLFPTKPPDIIFETPNGMFKTGKRVCVNGITGFHSDNWKATMGLEGIAMNIWGCFIANDLTEGIGIIWPRSAADIATFAANSREFNAGFKIPVEFI